MLLECVFEANKQVISQRSPASTSCGNFSKKCRCRVNQDLFVSGVHPTSSTEDLKEYIANFVPDISASHITSWCQVKVIHRICTRVPVPRLVMSRFLPNCAALRNACDRRIATTRFAQRDDNSRSSRAVPVSCKISFGTKDFRGTLNWPEHYFARLFVQNNVRLRINVPWTNICSVVQNDVRLQKDVPLVCRKPVATHSIRLHCMDGWIT